jgi:hypothetical protein
MRLLFMVVVNGHMAVINNRDDVYNRKSEPIKQGPLY